MSHFSRRPQSPAELIAYARRELGEPVINLELNDEQCLDRVYEAVEKFIYEHFDGVTVGWFPYMVSRTDIENGYLTLPDDVVSILGIVDLNLPGGSAEEFERVNFIMSNSDWVRQVTYNHGGQGLLSWHLNYSHLELLMDYFSPQTSFQFNETTRKLYLNTPLPIIPELPEPPEEDPYEPFPIILHSYRATNPDTETDVYANEWVRRYTTALIGRQWGSNIRKYDGVQLPGGVTLNGVQIYEMYNQMVEKLDQEFDLRYKMPGEMFIY